MLVKTIYDAYTLREEFIKMNRDYFTFTAYERLIDLFDECDCGKPTELDVIAICCEFNEDDIDDIIDYYESDIMDFAESNGYDTQEMSADEKIELVEEYLNYNTWATPTEDGKYLYQAF